MFLILEYVSALSMSSVYNLLTFLPLQITESIPDASTLAWASCFDCPYILNPQVGVFEYQDGWSLFITNVLLALQPMTGPDDVTLQVLYVTQVLDFFFFLRVCYQ